MNTSKSLSSETVLKRTVSRCTMCHHPAPAEVIKISRDGQEQVVMRRNCERHGIHEYTISTDARFYWLAKGDPSNSSCGCSPSCCSSAQGGKDGYLGKNAVTESALGTVEKLSTCLALIEIVDSCNLACPTCFANSPVGTSGARLKYHNFEDITSRIQGVIDRKGKIEIIQFSGGEPTIHPEFFRLAQWVRLHPQIEYLLINTNGVRFAKDEPFVEEMGRIFSELGNIQLYLQFDGIQDDGHIDLRGHDLREIKEKAIQNCARVKLPITLAMTVNETNVSHLWAAVEYAKKFDHVRGISFQPMFLSGRTPMITCGNPLPQPITTADIILGLHDQSNGVVSLDDFTPLPCGDPNCATIGWLFRMGGTFYSPSTFGIDIPSLQASLPDRVNYSIEDLKRCGCENTTLGDLMKKLEVKESNAFRFFIKPFMDARMWDQDRIDRCCTHVIRPDGKLDSFCRYYSQIPPQEGTCC